MEVTVKLLDKNLANCYDFKQMENGNASLMIKLIWKLLYHIVSLHFMVINQK